MIDSDIALAFDGWSVGSDYYVSIFACLSSDCNNVFLSILLNLPTFGNGKRQDADTHIDYLKFVFECHEKGMSDVVAFAADNCCTDPSGSS